jgi:hypothetical protein
MRVMSNANKFSDLADLLQQPRTVTPREAAHAAATSVQTSLFGRLRKARGSAVAGRVAWMLVRLGQGDHADSGAACEALQGFADSDVRTFLLLAHATRDSLRAGPGAALAGAVAAALEVEGGRRGW